MAMTRAKNSLPLIAYRNYTIKEMQAPEEQKNTKRHWQCRLLNFDCFSIR